tara:strand:- start:962 stop:1159 length:198 start_codon:yes stop_codon:yes gene_type:complete
MKVGDLIRPIVPEQEIFPEINPYLMQVIEIAKTGFSAIILSGPHMGREHFYPYGSGREWETISNG